MLPHRFLCPASRLGKLRATLGPGPLRLGLILDRGPASTQPALAEIAADPRPGRRGAWGEGPLRRGWPPAHSPRPACWRWSCSPAWQPACSPLICQAIMRLAAMPFLGRPAAAAGCHGPPDEDPGLASLLRVLAGGSWTLAVLLNSAKGQFFGHLEMLMHLISCSIGVPPRKEVNEFAMRLEFKLQLGDCQVIRDLFVADEVGQEIEY